MTKTKITKKAPVRKKTAPAKSHVTSLRDHINVAALIEALEQHVLGEKEMTATQVNAALALLKKTLPDIVEPLKKALGDTDMTAHEDALTALE